MKKLVILGLGVALLGAGFVGAKEKQHTKPNKETTTQHEFPMPFRSFEKLDPNNKNLVRALAYKAAETLGIHGKSVVLVADASQISLKTGPMLIVVKPQEYKNAKGNIDPSNNFADERNISDPLFGIPVKNDLGDIYHYCGWKESRKKRKSLTGYIIAAQYPIEKEPKKTFFVVENQR